MGTCIIQFVKKKRKRDVLRFMRDDQSVTWTYIHPGQENHDFAHLAVESTLSFKKGFYGLLNEGIEISDFELPKAQKPARISGDQLPWEAVVTEFIVNHLQSEPWHTELGGDFIGQLKETLKIHQVKFPEMLTTEKLDEIRQLYYRISTDWADLNDEGTLEYRMDL